MKKIRMKTNKYARTIDAELDLHGYTQWEAKSLLEEFLDEAETEGYRRVRIVTGKGLHSPDGIGVIKELVETMLRQAGYKFVEGKIDEGGSGALIVTLTR